MFIHSFHVYWTPMRCQVLFQTFPVIDSHCPHGASVKLFIPVPSCEPSMQYHTLGNIGWVHWVSWEFPFMSGMESFTSHVHPCCKEQDSSLSALHHLCCPRVGQLSESTAKGMYSAPSVWWLWEDGPGGVLGSLRLHQPQVGSSPCCFAPVLYVVFKHTRNQN